MASKHRLEYQDELLRQLRDVVDVGGVCVVHGSAGKAEFLRTMYPDLVLYDSREILEPRNLGGLYILRDGDLHYIDGILVEAMKTGASLCFKRIDLNIALLQYLRPVISGRSLVSTSGILVAAHPQFRLFFTALQTFPLRNVTFIGPIRFAYSSLMESFGEIREPVEDALSYISSCKAQKCTATRGLSCDEICLKDDPGCGCATTGYLCSSHFRMLCGLRTFLLSLKDGASIGGTNFNRCVLYQGLVNYVLKHDSARLSGFLHAVHPPLVFPSMNFAKTRPVESALRGLIANIRCKQPTLLVGETGAGKTALVQYLCTNSHYFFSVDCRLKVINMSSDFDGPSLIGGYQSIDFDARIKELYTRAGMEMPSLTSRKAHLHNILACCDKLEGKERCMPVLGQVSSDARLYLRILGQKLAFCFKEGVLVRAMREGTWLLLDEINLAPRETLDLLEALLSKDRLVLYENGSSEPLAVHPNFMVFACMNPFGDYGKKRYDSAVFNRIVFYDFSMSIDCIKAVVRSVSRNMLSDVDSVSGYYYELRKGVCSKQYSNVIEPLITGRTLCRAVDLALKLGSQGHSAPLYSAFSLLFLTQLDLSSRAQAFALYRKYFKTVPSRGPVAARTENERAWCGSFVLTPKVRIHVNDVELAIQAGLPVLLQGDTATGKTSLVTALARKHGTSVIRVNNHEHTDASDYVGNYATARDGIVFKEGVLLTALRSGSWLILDELNLAPSDVLEVLNRLLDDNRELYVPELDEIIKPHPRFRLFATQNIRYGGRQGLAKSFRNRFVEIFFYEKDDSELQEIIEKRCSLPSGFVKLIMSAYAALRGEQTLNSLITLRDLFKWAGRGPRSYFEVYELGLDILMTRQRKPADRERVWTAMNDVFRDRMCQDRKDYSVAYRSRYAGLVALGSLNSRLDAVAPEFCGRISEYNAGFLFNNVSFAHVESAAGGMVLTSSYLRLIDLVYKAWLNYEPVLLIGETGIGKTKICEVVSSLFKIGLRTVNMHNEIESSDFIGQSVMSSGEITWRNGPLVKAMINGDALLIDEINLAEDAVLERMNSVLEDRRLLYVTEIAKEFRADDRFRIVATMNPGGDYGKREISPALRNRFTEIYFQLGDEEYLDIFSRMASSIGLPTEDADYYRRMLKQIPGGISIRRVELIIKHIANIYVNNRQHLYGLGSEQMTHDELDASVSPSPFPGFCLVDPVAKVEDVWADVLELLGFPGLARYDYSENEQYFGVVPYYLRKCASPDFSSLNFCFASPTVRGNLQRLIRGLTLRGSILLKGEPGVGKTSIIQTVAQILGIPVVRINFSEQTEMSDLVGTYLPNGQAIRFVESEMVAYARKGYWIILDEINLCTQSVIEGLNSMLDHRRSVCVDDADVPVHPDTRIFGTMNPANSLNGRKQLPKSFLDRFIVIHMDAYGSDDIREIIQMRYGRGFSFCANLSLRGNIKLNEMKKARGGECICAVTAGFYHIGDTFRIGELAFPSVRVDESYVLIHSQLLQLEELMCCLKSALPVILAGDIGRTPMLRFVAALLGMEPVVVDCHGETDAYDLLGQYQKAETGDALFVWKNSNLVDALARESLLIVNMPELVDKTVFDRLSPLFESDRVLSIYERGTNTKLSVNPNCRLVLCCDQPSLLSPALIDRCHMIHLSSDLSYIDLYKIFHANAQGCDPRKLSATGSPAGDFPKRIRCRRDNDRFRELLGGDEIATVPDLDLAVKRHTAHGLMPGMLSRRLPIYNALFEERIDELFQVKFKDEIPYDRDLLEKYKYMASLSSPLGRTYRERIANLKACNSLAVLIKNLEYGDGPAHESSCLEAPSTLKEYKISFIKNLKNMTLGDWAGVIYFVDHISEIKEIEDVPTAGLPALFDQDPLLLVKCEMQNEMISRENSSLEKIASIAKQFYKYGSLGSDAQSFSLGAELRELVREYDAMVEHYSGDIARLNKKLGRDYSAFRETAEKITFCDYFRNGKLRLFLEEFSDVFDCSLLMLFKERHTCNKCASTPSQLTTRMLSLKLLRAGEYTKCTQYEYARYLYEVCMGISYGSSGLVFEAICFEETVDPATVSAIGWRTIGDIRPAPSNPGAPCDEFTSEEIDECLRHLVPRRTTAQAIETRMKRITLGRDFMPCALLENLSIFSTPEALVERLHGWQLEHESRLCLDAALGNGTSALDDTEPASGNVLAAVLEFLKNCYRHESCLSLDRNYRYFMYFLLNPITAAAMESFFLGSTVYEFIDRMYFACKYLEYSYTDLLYNIILQYKAFELEDAYSRKTRECRLKIFKEPRLYESTLRTYVDRFMYIPVTSLLQIRFEQPGCQKIHDWQGPSVLLKKLACDAAQPSSCECEAWLSLAKGFSRAEINTDLGDAAAPSRDELIHRFYSRSRSSSVQFSYAELCLAKTFNTVMENMNKRYFDGADLHTIRTLLGYAMDYVFPPFLYFIYKFADTARVDIEDGVALKSGQGAKQMEGTIQEEDICDDIDNNQAEEVDSEGVEMDNDGDLHSVSGESDGISGVDDQNNSGEKEEEDMEERGALDQDDVVNEAGVEPDEVPGSEAGEDEDRAEEGEMGSSTDGESTFCDTDVSSEKDDECASSDSILGPDNGEPGEVQPDGKQDTLASYEWMEAALNREQTCTNADGYNRKVEGGNLEEQDALAEGEGEEMIEGEGEAGNGIAIQKRVLLAPAATECSELVELLRVILASNKNSKYKGDYKTGRKLNLKKIIPYIASDYRKDRIWMRRRKNDKKEYVIRLFIDNSKSMYDQKMVDVLGAVYSKLSHTFSVLNIPVLLFKFGKVLQECTIDMLTFCDESTSVEWIDDYDDGINIVLTDGIFQKAGAFKSNFLVIMIDKGDIRKMSKVSVIDGQVFVEKYLSTFALRYCILENVEDLERIFVEALGELIKNLV